jgi:hypothetical protein
MFFLMDPDSRVLEIEYPRLRLFLQPGKSGEHEHVTTECEDAYVMSITLSSSSSSRTPVGQVFCLPVARVTRSPGCTA